MIKVKSVEYAGDYRLTLGFSDGTRGVADLTPILEMRGLAKLRDKALFAQAFVELDTVCWPGGLDLAPERLYALAHGLSGPATLEEARANELEVSLRELRKMSGLTQLEVAAVLEMNQGQLSRFEGQKDRMLSTLRRYVQALGGELEVAAVIGGKRVVLGGV